MKSVTVLYEDMVRLPHYQSEKRPHMPVKDRAAQFSPFAALTGYEAVLEERAKEIDKRPELSEDQSIHINTQLCWLEEHMDEEISVSVDYFQPDERKSGGRCRTYTGHIKKIDSFHRRLVFADGTEVDLDAVLKICCSRLPESIQSKCVQKQMWVQDQEI